MANSNSLLYQQPPVPGRWGYYDRGKIDDIIAYFHSPYFSIRQLEPKTQSIKYISVHDIINYNIILQFKGIED